MVQLKGTTDMNTFIIEFLGQEHRVIVIIHKQVVSLVTETAHETEHGITQCRVYPGIYLKVHDVPSDRLRQEDDLHAILLQLLGVVDLDVELTFEGIILSSKEKFLQGMTRSLQH